jgi:hypothetical protein
MKEISSMDFPQYGGVFYFYGHAFIMQRKKSFWRDEKNSSLLSFLA